MTKGEIDRLGEKIRIAEGNIDENTLQELQNFRTSHKDALSEVFNFLCSLSKKASNVPIVTYRIKRFESIIGKLKRKDKMKLSRMWDIGGCRCILKSNNDVYKLKELIETHPELTIRKEYDYIKVPKEEGYKSLHLFVTIPNNPIVIEVQIRNQIDHNWATLVEITDFLFDAKLKEYGENKDLLKFHLLLSQQNQLDINSKKELANIIKNYNYLDKLSEVFSKNYIQVRKQWLAIEEKPSHKFFLIVSRKDEVPQITSFFSFVEAEETYFNMYKNAQSANIVLTHLPSPNYNQISIAYSNYVLTFHSFFDDCYEMFESLLTESLKKRKYFDFIKYYELYTSMVYNHIYNLVKEIMEVNKIPRKTTNLKNVKLNNKEKEWKLDIDKQIKKRQTNALKLQTTFARNTPDSVFGRMLFSQLAKRITNKYKKKLDSVLKF